MRAPASTLPATTLLRATILLATLLSAGPLTAPAQAQEPPPACPFAGQTPTLLVRLYFGQSTPAGAPISRRAWQRFVAERVTAALPDGFTVLDAYGQFRDPQSGRIGREASEVVEVAAADTPALRARLATLADSYRRQFNQISVGIVSQTVCARF